MQDVKPIKLLGKEKREYLR